VDTFVLADLDETVVRLKIPDTAAIPWLPDLIRQQAPT